MKNDTLFSRATGYTERTAIVDDEGPHTYGELLEASARVASALLNETSDLDEQRVTFLAPPGFQYTAVQWGIWRAGGVAVPHAVMHPTPELDFVLEDADPCQVIVHPQFEERLRPIANARGLRLLLTPDACAVGEVELPRVDQTRRAMILYTSGTTSKPKGVVTTHATIRAQVRSLVEAWAWHADDRILNVLPMHHIHGIINLLGCALWSGAACEFMPFNAEGIWRRFGQKDLTLFMAVPTVYTKLIQAWRAADEKTRSEWSAALRAMRLMVSGSAALPVSTLETWQRISGHVLLERYGMTEIGMGLSNPLDGERVPGAVGRPLPGVQVRRMTEDGREPGDDEPGEIEIRGENVFTEYWRQPTTTQEAFRDTWFRTGDIAVKEHGVYRILGRASVDIIKTGGYKISALEVEETLRTHPAIRECAVVGIPDEEWGERVSAALVLAEDSLTLETLRAWAKERLAVYKVPKEIVHVAELPRNAMGKVNKNEVKGLFLQ